MRNLNRRDFAAGSSHTCLQSANDAPAIAVFGAASGVRNRAASVIVDDLGIFAAGGLHISHIVTARPARFVPVVAVPIPSLVIGARYADLAAGPGVRIAPFLV